jgi:hypothetical protein
VRVEVEATTAAEAEQKALGWSGVGVFGHCEVGPLMEDDDFIYEDAEMYWEIEDVCSTITEESIELDDDGDGDDSGM